MRLQLDSFISGSVVVESPVAVVDAIRVDLRAAADASLAQPMQAYMKSTMPYLGVRMPEVRGIVLRADRAHAPPDAPGLLEASARLWDEATHREHRYAATILLESRRAHSMLASGELRRAGLLELAERMIRSGGWWDHVDAISHRVGDLLAAHRDEMTTVIGRWAIDEDRWIRRSAIICQLQARRHTDRRRLAQVIEANVADTDFFVRKAIGWALRDFARTDPTWVIDFAATRGLSPLSRREALKRLSPAGTTPGRTLA